jgi:exodeoxyribonuclease V beta subunit
MSFNHFYANTTALTPGINLIEASAGTGKTFTIAMLIARFVVEKAIPIEQLLVVTFTKAATEELKDRIRKRLIEVKAVLDGNSDTGSDISAWLDSLDISIETIRSRLNLALLNIDQADIFTIHGFCQRILSEHALESGQLFDCQLTEDIDYIRQRCADDFWRRQIYLRNAREAAVLMQKYSTPDDLLASLPPITADYRLLPESPDLETLFLELQQIADQLPAKLDSLFLSLKKALENNKFKKGFLENLIARESTYYQWAQGESFEIPDFRKLSWDGLFAQLHGNKLRGDDKKQHYLESLNLDVDLFGQLQTILQQIDISFRQLLYKDLLGSMRQQLEHENLLSFDDLITRLAEALQSPQQQQLIESIQKRYQAAFIDEFQDTDQNQWTIFSRLFQSAEQYLYLIGDPKQAIYKFRGADIYSYFAAQTQARHLFTLHYNWRSHPALVDAVNRLFSLHPHPFQFEQLSFKPVKAALTAEAGEFRQKNQSPAPLALMQLEKNPGKQAYWNKTKASSALLNHVANEILAILTEPASIYSGKTRRPVNPEDIAILVKTHAQAQQYQQILAQCGIPAILNSKESVFASPEANDLYCLLQALEQPGNISLLKQALACSWFGLDGQQIYRLSLDETSLEQWLSRFHHYHQLWQQHGLLSMITALFQQENIPATIARAPQAERRLTNINHLVELLQQAATEHHLGPNKTLTWLHQAITRKPKHEATQLRLESDDNAVTIITLHSAKGLEYPIVFCPTLWDVNQAKNTKKTIQFHQNHQIWLDFGSANYPQHLAQAQQEQLAEDIRLFYVAVTRAKYRCYLYWADVRTRDTCNQSAMGWLLKLAEQDFDGQQHQLNTFAQQWPQSFSHYLLEANAEIQGSYQQPVQMPDLNARKRHRTISTDWQMSSYTALSGLSQNDTPELPLDKTGETEIISPDEKPTLLPKGAHTGNVLHEILEKIPFKTLAAGENIEHQRQQSCRRYGLNLERPEMIDQMLQTAVTTPLSARDSHFTLASIDDRHCIKEMPFYLSVKTLQTGKINALLEHCPAFQPLSNKSLSGFLTGFIDLICYYAGRYYVMDYKSNALDDYSPNSLTKAMHEHNYGLQYWLYSLVLHYYLQQRLPDYDFEQHFGGIKYLFLRGMQATQPESGVYSDCPDVETLEQLAALFYPSVN